jgi:signal transduction histidine kinase/CheY-like chemotaxis protein
MEQRTSDLEILSTSLPPYRSVAQMPSLAPNRSNPQKLSRLDRLMPAELRGSPTTRIRATVGIVFPLVYLALSAIQALSYAGEGAWLTASLIAASIPFVAAAPWLLLRTRSLELSAHVTAAVFLALIAASAYVQGGTDWRSLMYLGPLVLYTLLLGGVRPAATWFVVGAIGIAALFGLSAAGFPFPSPETKGSLSLDMMELLMLPTMVFLVAFIYHRVNASVLAELNVTSAALVRIREGLDDAQRLAQVGSWEFDGHTNLLTWSKALLGLLGVPLGAPLTIEAALAHIHADDRAVLMALFDNVCASGGRAAADIRMLRADGAVQVLHFIFSRVSDVDDGPSVVVGTCQDVTEARTAETQLIRAREQALVASEAKSQFLSHMSHEIRTPMNGVIGLTSLALGTPLDAEQREYVEGARTAGLNLLTIIDDILDLTKVEAGELRTEQIPFSLRKVLGEVVDTVAHGAARKGLALRLEIDPALAQTFRGDPVRVRQILLNLAGNAVKFTTEGAVTLRAGADPERPGAVRVVVEDTGPGIAPDAQLRVFESFQQADVSTTRRFGGTGLGLTISRKLAELMDGRLWVTSEVGTGSCFTLQLPLEVVTGLEAVEAAATVAAPARSLVVLLAEDSAVNSLVASRLLGRAGHRVIQVKNGREAVDAALSQVIDVVLMDVQMPELDGLEATRLIRRHEALHGGYLPIVALTAGAMKGDDETCYAAGMDAFLSKPLDPRRLEAAVVANAERKRAAPAV